MRNQVQLTANLLVMLGMFFLLSNSWAATRPLDKRVIAVNKAFYSQAVKDRLAIKLVEKYGIKFSDIDNLVKQGLQIVEVAVAIDLSKRTMIPAKQIARMKTKQGLSWHQITDELEIPWQTTKKALYANAESTYQAARESMKRNVILKREKRAKLRRAGKTTNRTIQ